MLNIYNYMCDFRVVPYVRPLGRTTDIGHLLVTVDISSIDNIPTFTCQAFRFSIYILAPPWVKLLFTWVLAKDMPDF